MQNIPIITIAAVSAVTVVYFISKTKHPVRNAFKNAMAGIMSLLLVNLTAMSTGCYISINFYTVFAAVFLSVPGVIGMLLLNIIFI